MGPWPENAAAKSLRWVGSSRSRASTFLLAAGDTEFHRIVAEHGDEYLLFDGRNAWVGPHQRVVVGNIDQRHRVAPVETAFGTHRLPSRFREGTLGLVARRAGLLAVARKACVVEQVSPEFHLGGGHGVMFGHRGSRIAIGYVPGVFGGGTATPNRQRDDEDPCPKSARVHWVADESSTVETSASTGPTRENTA